MHIVAFLLFSGRLNAHVYISTHLSLLVWYFGIGRSHAHCIPQSAGLFSSAVQRLTGERRGSEIRCRARWCHILPSLHYGGHIYDIMVCWPNKTFGCHGHAHLLDLAPEEKLFSLFARGALVHG